MPQRIALIVALLTIASLTIVIITRTLTPEESLLVTILAIILAGVRRLSTHWPQMRPHK